MKKGIKRAKTGGGKGKPAKERGGARPSQPTITAHSTRKKHEDRALGGTLFVTSDMTAAEVAAKLHVSPKTVGKWREADNWDEERTLLKVSPSQLIKRLNKQIELVCDRMDGAGVMLPADADMIAKLTSSVKRLRNSIDPQTTMEVLNGFMAYLSHINLNAAQTISEHCIGYVRVKMKEVKQK